MVPTIWLQYILKVKGKSQARWHKPTYNLSIWEPRQNHLQFQTDLDYNWKTTSKKQKKLSYLYLSKVITSQYP